MSRKMPREIETGRKDAMLGEPLRRGLSARGPEDYTLSQDAPSAGRPTSTQQTSQHTSDDMLALVLNSLDDDKA